MKATVRITKHLNVWTLYIQKGKHRWLHLASQGTPGLKARAAQYNAEKRDYEVTNREVWAHVDCTCQRCHGSRVAVDITGEGTACPRCAGKGYVTVSDETRYNEYLKHMARVQAGVQADRDAYYERLAHKHCRTPQHRARVAANKAAAKAGIKYCRDELAPPRDYASMSRGY